MFEKIKSQLMANKGTNSVSKRTLEGQAQLLAPLITTEEQLAAFDFAKYVSEMGGNVSHDVAEQVRLAKEELEKKYSDRKTPEQIAADEAEKKKLEEANEQKGITPEMQAILDQNKTIMETLSKMQGEKITTSRLDVFKQTLKDHPDQRYVADKLQDFSRISFKDDEDFAAYNELTKQKVIDDMQHIKENNITFKAPNANVKNTSGEDVSADEVEMFKDINSASDESKKQF